MALLPLSLLGPPAARHGDREIQFPTRKALALLAYLASEPAVHSRDRLTSLLWPDSDPERARTSLRTTLSLVRRALREAAQGDHLTGRARFALRADPDLRLHLLLGPGAAA